MGRPVSLLLAVCCLCLSASISVRAQMPLPKAAQAPDQTPAPKPGPIPPRDPRLPPPNVTETTIPPNVVLPPPPAGTVPAEVPVHPITADDAARIALRFQPNIDIAQAGIEVQKGRTRQIRAGLMPQVTVLGSYTHVQNLTGGRSGGSVPNSTVSTGGASGTGGAAGGSGSTGSTTGNSGAGGSTGTGGASGTGTAQGSGGTSGSGTTTGATGTSQGSGSTGAGVTGTGGTTVSSPTVSSSSLAQGFTAESTLRQLIFDFNHTLDLTRQSVELERAAAQNLTRVQNDTVLDVKDEFYLLVQNLQQVQVDTDEVSNRQSQLDLARSRYNTGLGLASDVVTAETAKAEAILNLSQARANTEQARINLAISMGIDPRTPLVPTETVEPIILSNDVNSLTQMALTRRPEVLQAQFSLRSAQYGVNAARSTNAPSLSGAVSAIAVGDQFLPQQSDLTLGVQLTWTPIDGGVRRGLVQEARGNVTIAQKQLYIAQQTVKSDVASAYINLRSSEQRVTDALADVANAEEGVRIATGRYSTGLGLFLDIINAQAFLLTARTNLVNTRNAVAQFRATLQHAMGAPIPPVH